MLKKLSTTGAKENLLKDQNDKIKSDKSNVCYYLEKGREQLAG